jgi:hypothetical protein
MRRLALVVAVLLAWAPGVASANTSDECGITCERGTDVGGSGSSSISGTQDLIVVGGGRPTVVHRATGGSSCQGCAWDFKPACFYASPGPDGNDAMCLRAATACQPNGGILMYVYFHDPAVGGWDSRGTECLGGTRRAIPAQRLGDQVRQLYDRLDLPAPSVTVQPNDRAVVGVPVIVYAGAQSAITTTFFPSGVDVTVTATPVEWRWTFAGQTTTTTFPGHRYDGHDALDRSYYVTHTYARPGGQHIGLTVRWVASYRIAGLNQTFAIPDRLTTSGAEIVVRESRARLVEGTGSPR